MDIRDFARSLHRLLDTDTRLSAIESALLRIEGVLQRILTQETKMSANLATLTTEVAEISTVVDGAVLLISQLADLVRALPADQSAIDALAAQLDGKASELAAALVANTPAS